MSAEDRQGGNQVDAVHPRFLSDQDQQQQQLYFLCPQCDVRFPAGVRELRLHFSSSSSVSEPAATTKPPPHRPAPGEACVYCGGGLYHYYDASGRRSVYHECHRNTPTPAP